jgi:iron complex transport system substrate-binding protein
MKKYIVFALAVVVVLLSVACTGKGSKKNGTVGEADSAKVLSPEYAKGFSVRVLDNGIRLVDVVDPQ